MSTENGSFDPHLDDHTDDHPSSQTSTAIEVQQSWDDFQAKLAAGDVEYVDPAVLDEMLPPDAPYATDMSGESVGPELPFRAEPAALMTLAGYTEHASVAIKGLLVEMARVGAGDDGNVGNAAHTYGWHLSANRLAGTGKSNDYSMVGSMNVPIADHAAACAQDVIMNWPGCRVWVAWLFREFAADRLAHCVELIGSIDGATAMYAGPSSGNRMVRYTGIGHVDWAHVAHGRRFCNITTWGKELLGKFDRHGLAVAGESGADMSMVTLSKGRIATVVRGTDKRIYRLLTDVAGKTVDDWQLVGNMPVASGVDACTRFGDDLWAVALDPKDDSVLVFSTPDVEGGSGLQVQDIGGAGIGGAPGITASGNNILVTVAGTYPRPGTVYMNVWNGAGWSGWKLTSGTAA